MIVEIVALLLMTAAGIAVGRWLDRSSAGLSLIGEGMLLGIGISAVLLLVLPWNRIAFAFVLIAVAAMLRLRRPWPAASPIDLITLILLAGYARFATMAPLWEFDYIGGFGLKGRHFFEARGIDWRFLESAPYLGVHPDYPPLLPLSFDVLALARGAWDDWAQGLLNVAFALALLLVIRGLGAEETCSKHKAAFVAAAMVPLAASPWIGLAEGPLIAFGTSALLLLRRGSVAAGAVLLGLGALTKNEGLTLIVAAAAGLAAAKRWRDVPRLWPAVALALPWLVLRQLHHFRSDLAEGSVVARVIEHLRDPRPLLDALAANPPGRPLFWIALAAGVALAVRPLLARERLIVVAVVVQLAFYIVAYLATPHDVAWQVRWSWERLISHLTPALSYAVLVNLLRPDSHAAA